MGRSSVLRALAALVLCLLGAVALSYAWFVFVFAGATTNETAAKVGGVVIAIVTVLIVGLGLFLLYGKRRGETRLDPSTCAGCGKVFPSAYYLQDAGPRGFLCDACAAGGTR